jgi:hypothetical protein
MTKFGRFLILKTSPELYPNPSNEVYPLCGRPIPYTEPALPHQSLDEDSSS